MKTNKIFFYATIVFVLSFSTVEAQYGYGNGYNNGYGNGRVRNQMPQTQSNEKPEPLTAEEIVDLQMPKILEVIDLNSFEEAVLSTTLTKYIKKYMELQILKLDGEKMKESIEKLKEQQSEELKAALPKEKYEAYVALEKEGFKKAKKKKKKKTKRKE
ncbi:MULTISPECIES: hypothetical protein [Cellulophaga]|uniref:Uncharacterized protein n=2 Tax=Cellulophaga TaxID=104264 RepID=F0RAG5_CELLC|nr:MULTISPECIES: hypothetical protein [Cellulophaga]ADY30528.1 hypothetical protein Celly_2711 [Cellulophaga lytica DSM 7489]AIM61517.1 hypothetical protein IX49_13655 [Cellulophaga lytica]APU11410.1 hypothetical protein A5M85_14315 [Cellulophaga lytica]EWH13951.1 hypothetical protein KLA_06467 [Cellulophaga geojensis KL-A]MDO6853221.1 hypothetical protein [Cellulophaga lytica]